MTNKTTKFPKIIYAFWMQGRENVPEMVRINFDRWERLNPDYKLIVLDKETARPYVKGFPIDAYKLTVQAFSDILRARILAQNGGIWIDATLFPVIPLSKWLDAHLAGHTFFAGNSDCDQVPITSWFIVASKGDDTIKKWNDLIARYWFMEREHKAISLDKNPMDAMRLDDFSATSHYPYFWVHHLFAHLLKTDAQTAAIWKDINKLPRVNDGGLHGVFRVPLPPSLKKWMYARGLIGPRGIARIKKHFRRGYVQKLNWREKFPMHLLERLADKVNKSL